MSRYGINNEDDEPGPPEVLDEADQASLIQMSETKQAIAKVTAKLAPEKHPDFDGEHCVECGEAIPAARLAFFKVRCVHCQSALELKGKLYAPKREE